jgi:hypothetical protein
MTIALICDFVFKEFAWSGSANRVPEMSDLACKTTSEKDL